MRKSTAAVILSAAIAGVNLFSPTSVLAQVKAPPPAVANAAEGPQQVPVKEVVLFTSGVGYFEHFGTVRGDGNTELSFKTEQINDILKSLLLEDLDGGKVTAVSYSSQEPLEHALRSFQVDLSGNPPLAQLLGQLRGATVTVSSPQGKGSGAILGVEKKQRPVDENKTVDVWVLNLLLDDGSIRPVELEQVSSVKLDDPKLQQELKKALMAVAAARDQDKKPVSIRFTGKGERHIRIGYVVEAPVWKASYRLVLSEDATNEQPPIDSGNKPKPPADPDAQGRDKDAKNGDAKGAKLQGWAIIENQTDSDWEDVQLSLVSGRPISFIQDLYQPLYVPRPVIQPELFASLRPQTYEGGMREQEVLSERVEEAKAGAEGMKQLRQMASSEAAPQMLARRSRGVDAAGMGGGGFGRVAGKPMDATASISAVASAAKVGELFQYTVPDVTLARQKSAMIPIVTDPIKARRLSIYNQSVFADHPLLGARLTNTTGKLLPQGPVTVLDGPSYAGDAKIDDVPGGQDRLLSFGIDQQMLVHGNDQTQTASLVTAKIIKGVLELTSKQSFSQDYKAENKGKTPRTLLIEHPKHAGWALTEPKKALETTDALYRFEEEVPANQNKTLTVKEELISSQGVAILPMDTGQIEVYLRTAEIPQKVKGELSKAAKLKYAQADTQRQIAERQQKINEVTQEQNRIRENMKTVAANSEYYQRLLKKLDEQETSIEKLQGEVKDLQKTQEQQRKELEDFLVNLSVG